MLSPIRSAGKRCWWRSQAGRAGHIPWLWVVSVASVNERSQSWSARPRRAAAVCSAGSKPAESRPIISSAAARATASPGSASITPARAASAPDRRDT